MFSTNSLRRTVRMKLGGLTGLRCLSAQSLVLTGRGSRGCSMRSKPWSYMDMSVQFHAPGV
jgi:hypothetical protein